MSVHVAFVSEVPDLPEFEALLLDYYTDVLKVAKAAGVPSFQPQEQVAQTLAHLQDLLPPNGRLVLARDDEGRLVGCGTLRRIRPEAVEMKRMFVQPQARGQKIGQRLFEMRMQEARRMGYRAVYADTAKGNRAMLSMYERFGFRYIPRYPENANPAEYEPYLVYLVYEFPDVVA